MHKYWEHAICILVNKHGYICVYLEQDLKFGRQFKVWQTELRRGWRTVGSATLMDYRPPNLKITAGQAMISEPL